MNKSTFLKELKNALHRFSYEEIRRVTDYYDELISERVENGENEQAVIARLGSVKSIAAEVSTELVETRMVKNSGIKSTGRNFITILLLCASPALLPVAIAFSAVLLALGITALTLILVMYLSAAGLIIWSFPSGAFALSQAGAPGAMVTVGIIIFAACIIAATGALIQRICFKIIYWLTKGFAKTIKGILGR